MKSKKVCLTAIERIMMQAMIRMEIQSNKECLKEGVKPAFDTETLESIYQKLSGHKSGEV